jgi:GNAT superfamily N-acetyltransferase
VYKDGVQAGFARVVTDRATFAYLCDVFILPAHQGVGLSKWMMQTIMAHPGFTGAAPVVVSHIGCAWVYKQFGFKEISNPEVWMQIFTPYIAE